MTARIVQLSEDVINQIAAGEVIEHPASVVKELLDNAIDAAASSIQIEIWGGGHQKICVEDNGCGMSSADAALCLLRHATSKLKVAIDLEELKTMGFRGEALAAIASISKLEMRTSDGREATRLLAHGGKIEAFESAARNRGTTFEVHSLFFNAPARRKFQKGATASTAQIVKIVETLAMSHSEIAFTLSSQGQVLFNAPAMDWKSRLEQLLGEGMGVWMEEEGAKGMLGHPETARKTRGGQHFFLNRRPIFSLLLSKAVLEGYGTRVPEGLFPSFALFLELPPSEFDVNVHPQKKEVRFCDEGAMFRFVKQRVSRAWVKDSPVLPEISFSRPEPFFTREESRVFSSTSMPIDRELPWELPIRPKALALVGCFLLGEREGQVYLVDLREEQIEKALAPSSQPLLLPLEIELLRHELPQSPKLLERCKEAGIEARIVGERLWIEALPEWLEPKETPSFIEELKDSKDGKAAAMGYLRTHPSRWSLEEAALAWHRASFPKEKRLDIAELERLFRGRG